MHALNNTHINKVIADACTCQGRVLTHVRVKVGYIDRHAYVIVVRADTCTFKD